MVICKKCGRDIEPVPDPNGKGPDKCPKCNAFLPTKDRRSIKQFKPSKDGLYHFKVGATTSLNSDEMKLMENLVNIGAGESPNDVLKKGIHALAISYRMGGDIMQNANEKKEPVDPIKEMDDMDAREVRELTLEKMREKLKKGGALDSSEILDLVKQKQYMKMLEDMDQEKGEEGFGIKEMMQLQMIQSLTPQDRSNNGNEALVKQIQDLQMQIREKN